MISSVVVCLVGFLFISGNGGVEGNVLTKFKGTYFFNNSEGQYHDFFKLVDCIGYTGHTEEQLKQNIHSILQIQNENVIEEQITYDKTELPTLEFPVKNMRAGDEHSSFLATAKIVHDPMVTDNKISLSFDTDGAMSELTYVFDEDVVNKTVACTRGTNIVSGWLLFSRMDDE